MIIDFTVKEYYKDYIYSNNYYEKLYIEEYNKQKAIVEAVRDSFNCEKNPFFKDLPFDYKDYINDYDTKIEHNLLYKEAKKHVTMNSVYKYRAISVIRYFNKIRVLQDYAFKIEFVHKRNKLNKREYGAIIKKFVNKIHEVVLKGDIYNMGDRVGKLFIINKKVSKNRIYVDYAETNKNRKELLAKGLVPYDENDAEMCRRRGIPYNGVKYVVYKTNDEMIHVYYMSFISRYGDIENRLKFKPYKTMKAALKKHSYEYIYNNYCKTQEDIYKLDVALPVKIYLYKRMYPLIKLVYDRNYKKVHKR